MQCSETTFNTICLSNTNAINSELQSQILFLVLTRFLLEPGKHSVTENRIKTLILLREVLCSINRHFPMESLFVCGVFLIIRENFVSSMKKYL